MACVKRNGKWGFINKFGVEVIPCKFSNAESFSEGLAPVEIDGNVAYIDQSGRVVSTNKGK